jgi:hypothetical protein
VTNFSIQGLVQVSSGAEDTDIVVVQDGTVISSAEVSYGFTFCCV